MAAREDVYDQWRNSLYLFVLVFAGCGGDGGSATSGTGTAYAFTTPVLNSTDSYPIAIVNGTNYADPPMTQTYHPSGHELTNVYSNGAVFTCTFDPRGVGPDYPVQVAKPGFLTTRMAGQIHWAPREHKRSATGGMSPPQSR
jgi:hypothetical protein